MSLKIKHALHLEAFRLLGFYKGANEKKKRALVRGDLTDLMIFSNDEEAAWEKLKLGVDAFVAEEPAGSLLPPLETDV